MTDREKVEAKRQEIVQTIISYIEQNPTNWQAGWAKVAAVPQNGLTNSKYRGINALYLWLVSHQRGYTDNRWVTFNQAKEIGASVKKGEKSSPIMFYALYDKNTKKEYTRKTTADMTDEERRQYEDEFVKPVLRYSQVFNAEQCANFPEKATTPEMTDEERQEHNNATIERIIANSEAPVKFDGGDRAFYSIDTDDIHLPEIKQFHSMADYYATALHEIAHSTGHQSRLNRKFGTTRDDANYAIEELRAEMAAVFMQMENGIELEGKHIQNHSAYLASWLNRVKDDPKVFTSAISDAMKISDYITDHYVKESSSVDANVATTDDTKEKAVIATRYAILAAAMKVAHEDMSYVDARYTDTYLDAHFSERNRLAEQVQKNGVAPSIEPELIRALIDEYANPISIEYYGWDKRSVERALVEKIEDPALKEQATKMVYNYDSLQDKTPISKSNPLLTVEAKQECYYTGTNTIRNQQSGFVILHDRQDDKWYLWNDDFIEGKVITSTGTRERLTIGQSAKRSEILQTFDDAEKFLTAFDNVEQARDYWQKESAKITSLREQYLELNEYSTKRQSEIDDLMRENSLLFVESVKPNVQTVGKSIDEVDESTKENNSTIATKQEAVAFHRELPFSAQVDAVIDGTLATDSHVQVMASTPYLLQQVGLSKLPIVMRIGKLKDLMRHSGTENGNEHGLSSEMVKEIPLQLSNPTMILDSKSRPDTSVVVVTEILDKLNQPVIVALELNKQTQKGREMIEANLLSSAYGKRNFQTFLENNVENVLYWDKQKTQNLSVSIGLQLPNTMINIESDTIIRKSSAFVNAQMKKTNENIDNVIEAKPSMDDRLKDWYVKNYPDDMFGLRLDGTFKDLQEAIDNGGDANNAVMGIDNPIARERIFTHLAGLQGIKVSEIHNAWLSNKDVTDRPNDEVAATVSNVDENAQKKNPSTPNSSATSSQKWQSVTIPADCIGKEYGARTMVSIPKSSGYVGFAMFVPTKMLKIQEDGTYSLLYNNAKNDYLKATNDGREVVFDGETLDKVMRGEKVPYQAKRVRAGKEAQQMVEQTLANVPAEMQDMERWCVHQKYFVKDATGKTQVKKRIFDVNRIEEATDNFAKCNDATTWASIDRATSAIKTSKKSLTGLKTAY